MQPDRPFISCLLVPFLLVPLQASAYVGPGLGAGTLGVILGLVGSILIALFAFFWYPIKRALFGGKRPEDDEAVEAEPENAEPDKGLAPEARDQ